MIVCFFDDFGDVLFKTLIGVRVVELILFIVDERDERAGNVSIGDDRCLIKVDCFGCVGRVGVAIAGIGRRTGGVYFLIVAIAEAVDEEDASIGNDGLRRLNGPGRFSTSQEEADRCTP